MIASKRQILCYRIEDSHLLSLLGLSYEVINVFTQDTLLESLRAQKPSAIFAQIKSVTTESLIIKELRRNYLSFNVPIIVITSHSQLNEKIEALNGGVDEFIVSPYHEDELIARLNRVISRTEKALNANALTGLPGNLAIREKIESCISRNQPFAAYWIDIDHFKSFNDTFGYSAGDEVIHMLGKIVAETVYEADNSDNINFVGHIGGDDFIVLSDPQYIESIANRIIERFDSQVPRLYPASIRERGYVETESRRGIMQKSPMMSLSIAITCAEKGQEAMHYGQISQACSEIKSYLKKISGSKYLCDRRNGRKLRTKEAELVFFEKNAIRCADKVAL